MNKNIIEYIILTIGILCFYLLIISIANAADNPPPIAPPQKVLELNITNSESFSGFSFKTITLFYQPETQPETSYIEYTSDGLPWKSEIIGTINYSVVVELKKQIETCVVSELLDSDPLAPINNDGIKKQYWMYKYKGSIQTKVQVKVITLGHTFLSNCFLTEKIAKVLDGFLELAEEIK